MPDTILIAVASFALGSLATLLYSKRGNPMAGRRRRPGAVTIAESQFRELKSEPLFAALLLLARMSNSLRFAHTAPLEVYDEGTPRASRQVVGAFLLQVATAHEALTALRELSPIMKEHGVWRQRVVPLFRDPEIREIEAAFTKDLRRRIVFHFDIDVMKAGVEHVPKGELTFLSTLGAQVKDVYFPLADEVALSYLLSANGHSREEYIAKLDPWLRRATNLSLRIAVTVEGVATVIARELGLRGKWE